MRGLCCFDRWAYKPCGDVGTVLGEEGVAHPSTVLHGGAVSGSDLRRWVGESFHEIVLQFTRGRRELRRRRLQQGDGARS